MSNKLLPPLLILLALGGCSKEAPDAGQHQPPWVLSVGAHSDERAILRLSGTVQARYATPVAFQVGGRILSREVDAGQLVAAGQRLFRLDPRDLDESVRAAEAQLAAAEAAFATQGSELRRQRQLRERDAVSQQALERSELAERDAAGRRDAARAALAQARNARAYAELRAEAAGVLVEISGEPGQVVAAGQAVAVLAQESEREIEVFLPDGNQPPQRGEVALADGRRLTLELRELAGAADPLSRSWRARYRVVEGGAGLALGSVVAVSLATAAPAETLRVPLGALDERGAGPRIWLVVDGRAVPQPVEVLALDVEEAQIRASLPAGARIIALGTHLLEPGMAVRERAR